MQKVRLILFMGKGIEFQNWAGLFGTIGSIIRNNAVYRSE